jgi:AraC-like DNA-binding protein
MNRTAPHVFARHPQLPAVEVRTAQNSSACYWTHTHEEYSIGIIDAGQAMYSHGPHTSLIRAGTTVLIAPGIAHSCNPELGQVWSYRMLYLQTPWVLGILGLNDVARSSTEPPPFKQAMLQVPAVYRRLDRICKGIALVANPLALEEELLGVIDSQIQRTRPVSTDAGPVTPALQCTRDLLMARLEEAVTLDELAQLSNMSAFALVRKFKAAYGQTPHAFQLDQRINLSKRLLKQGLGLAEVSLFASSVMMPIWDSHNQNPHLV